MIGLKRSDAVQGFFQHKEPVYSVAMHPSQDSIVMIKQLTSHSDSVIATVFGDRGMDGRLFILELDGPSEVTWLNWHPRGNALLCGSSDGTLWMWAVPSGQCMNVFTGHSASVLCGQFTPDGKSIVSVMTKSATVKQTFQSTDARFLNGNPVTSLVVLAGGQDGSACLVHLGSGKVLGSVSKAEDSVESCGFSTHLPVGSVASIDGTIALWDITTMRLRSTFRHPKGITKTHFLKTAPLMLSASLDKTVRLWDLRTGTYQRSSMRSFVTCGEDGSAQVFLIE
ncbi:WD40 repeat-like protein [Rhizoclosmatium globosum]|uniref:WD40 repeat-like protein n=1 Tax=Rhizoclosmatium globosum TaxID=329046 RepID=A0A1Y2B773_9FUNG|nr:WD40 repeat-like protein [Rhizoclosmatium globosum]|eukprot:ORY30692.1 WD40 repeat-like protein [Rhizoclosmatium globosum]